MPYPLTGASSSVPHRRISHSGIWRGGGHWRFAGSLPGAAHGAGCRLNCGHVWNLCVVSLFAALVAQRLLLVAMNVGNLRHHPAWALSLAMVHHPLLSAVGALGGGGCAAVCAWRLKMPFRQTADMLAAPLALGLAFEQLGALLAGSGYGTETAVRWAVTYDHPMAAIWSGTPLGIPLHPVQAYAGLAFLTLSIFLLVWQPAIRQAGDLAGMGLMGGGVAVYITELWRDTEGRGAMLSGALDGPQLGAIVLVVAGALLLLERKDRRPDNEATHG